MIKQMSPVATAAAREGYRRLSLTPTQRPIGISDGRLNVENQSGPNATLDRRLHRELQPPLPLLSNSLAPNATLNRMLH